MKMTSKQLVHILQSHYPRNLCRDQVTRGHSEKKGYELLTAYHPHNFSSQNYFLGSDADVGVK